MQLRDRAQRQPLFNVQLAQTLYLPHNSKVSNMRSTEDLIYTVVH
jgi:hypothetical protein